MAGRHYLNDLGSCETDGDSNADSYEDILSRYYAVNATELYYFNVTTAEIRPYDLDGP